MSSDNQQKSVNELFKSDTQYTCQMQKMSGLVSTIDVKGDDISGGSIECDEYSENRLFIANFPFEWTEKELREFLKDYGPVDSVEIVYNDRGSKGFGFATINDAERCLNARRTLNGTVANGRLVEVRRAHKHKRATNTGPPQGPKQTTAETLEQIQSLNAFLMAQLQLVQLQQPIALQAALAQPGLFTLLQNQLAASALVKNYQAGVSSSCVDLPTYSNPTRLSTMASPAIVQSSQTQPVGSGREGFKTPMRLGQENMQQKVPTSGVNGFTQNIWDYSPQPRVEVDSTPRSYRLFNSPKTGRRNAFDRNDPIFASTQTVGYDDEGHIEFGQIPLCTSTPRQEFRHEFLHQFPHDRTHSFSMPDIHKVGHE